MLKNNFYIITGGPGGGKTTLLERLAEKGHAFIPETARQIIKERLSMGASPRPDPLQFATEIFERDCSNFSMKSSFTSLLFFDRSFIDSSWQIFTCDKNRYSQAKTFLQTHRYNNKVFITPPWKEIYHTDSERDQTFEQSVEVYEQLYGWYFCHNYNLIELPKTSVDNRLIFLLNHLAR